MIDKKAMRTNNREIRRILIGLNVGYAKAFNQKPRPTGAGVKFWKISVHPGEGWETENTCDHILKKVGALPYVHKVEFKPRPWSLYVTYKTEKTENMKTQSKQATQVQDIKKPVGRPRTTPASKPVARIPLGVCYDDGMVVAPDHVTIVTPDVYGLNVSIKQLDDSIAILKLAKKRHTAETKKGW